MTEINTKSTVTKLSESPKDFCKADNAKAEIVKTGGMAENTASINTKKKPQPVIVISKKAEDSKVTYAEKIKKIIKHSKSSVISALQFAKEKNSKFLNSVKKYSSHCLKYLKELLVRFKDQDFSFVLENKTDRLKSLYNVFKGKLSFTLRKFRTESGLKALIAGGLFVFFLIICSFTCSFGYKVTVGNRTLGIIPSVDMYNEIYQDINENVFAMTGEEFTLPDKASLSATIALNRNFQTKEQFAESLKAISSDMIPAYTVVIDDKMIVSLPSEEMALSAVNEYKNSFSSGIKETNLEFANNIEVVYMFAPKALLHSKDSAVTYLLNGEFSYYKAESDQTVSELSQKTGISEGMILKSNVLDGESVSKGQIVKLYSGRMFADVMAVEQVQREEVIPFETIEKNSEEMYQGITKIETAGSDGIKSVDEYVTYINGIEIKRDILHESVLKAPTAEVKLVGTKEPPPSVGTGILAMPTSGSLSSRFGSRWGRQHEGIDLSASVGTPIYAADNGTVTYSQFNDGGYGYMIQIDHGNGLITYYAHCSELLVNVGDVVAKGDLIAKVGNTGRSTGAHLHFEVRQNGTPTDPMNYIN